MDKLSNMQESHKIPPLSKHTVHQNEMEIEEPKKSFRNNKNLSNKILHVE